MRLLDPSYGSFSPLDRLTPHQGLSCPEGKSLGITGAESRVRATVVTWLHSCGSNKVGGHLNLLSPQEEGTGSGRTPSHLRSQGQDTVGLGLGAGWEQRLRQGERLLPAPCGQPSPRSHSAGRERAPGRWCKRGIGKGPGAPGPFYGCPVLRARTAMSEKGSQQDPK